MPKIKTSDFTQNHRPNELGIILPLTAILLAFVVIVAAALLYAGHRNPKAVQQPLRLPVKISKGDLHDTYAYNSRVFPNLPQNYRLIYKYTQPNRNAEAEYTTSKTNQEVKIDMINVCKAHRFTFQTNGGSGNVECIDSTDSWLFRIGGSADIQNQAWYNYVSEKLSSYPLTSEWTWLEVESAGAPTYN